MPMEPDHYGVLELPPGSSMEEVKSQYRRLAKRYHPDLHGDDAGFQEKFRRVNAAYTFLADAPRKAAYDSILQAARRAGAPPPTSAPPLKSAPRPSPTATGYHRPATAAGFHKIPREQPPDDVRMTRSAWLGATAGAVVVLLVIGLSLDGSGPGRPAPVGVSSSAAPGSASGSALGDGRGDGIGGGSVPGTDIDPSLDPPAAPFAANAAPAPPRRFPHIAPPPAAPPRPSIVGSTWTPPHDPLEKPVKADPAKADPAGALRRRLLARYHAVLPRTDRLLGRGYAVRAAGSDRGDGSRRILRDQLAADLADLSATRARIQPAISRLSRQGTPEGLRQESGPILSDLGRLENARQPVRDDLKALATISPAFHASPAAFRFDPTPPARAASVAPFPSAPAGPTPAAAPTAPKLPDKQAVKPVMKPIMKPVMKPVMAPVAVPTKPKAPASSGQEFIMWGK